MNTFLNKKCHMWLLGALALIVTGCSPIGSPQNPPSSGTATRTPVEPTHTLMTYSTTTTSVRPQRTTYTPTPPMPTNSFTKTKAPPGEMTPTTPPADDSAATKIVSSTDGKYIVTAFWSDAGQDVYYAFTYPPKDAVNWEAYDVQVGITRSISPLVRYAPDTKQELNLPDFVGFAEYPKPVGLYSPSGKHVIFTGNYTLTPASSTFIDRAEVWIADSSGQHRIKLFEGRVGGINQAVWLKDETKVIFDFGYEGGVNLFIADVASGEVVPLSDMSDFKRGTDQLWAVSPDGNYLAVIGGPGGSLWIISLEDGKTISIDSNVQNPFWSQDGTRVYYWWGPSFEEIGTLRAYDVTSKRVSTIISKEALTRIYLDLPHVYFAVAPNDDKAIFWGPSWLWVVELKP
jgi:hypothetical protein